MELAMLGAVSEPFYGWLTLPPEITNTVLMFASPESLIEASIVCRLWKGLSDEIGKTLVARAHLLLEDDATWQKVYRSYLDTIFFLVLDVSPSMDNAYIIDVDDKTSKKPSFLDVSKAKALTIAEHLEIPILKGKVFAIRLGKTCSSMQIGNLPELNSYFSTIAEDRTGTSLETLTAEVKKIADKFIDQNCGENQNKNRLPKIEINFFTDLIIQKMDFRTFSNLETYFRFFSIGKTAASDKYLLDVLKDIQTPMEIEEIEEGGLKRKRQVQTTFGVSSEVNDDEPLRVYKKARR